MALVPTCPNQQKSVSYPVRSHVTSLLLCLAAACSPGIDPNVTLDIRVLGPELSTSALATVYLRHGEESWQKLEFTEYPVGQSLPIDDTLAPYDLVVEVHEGTRALYGAAPTFVPEATGGLVVVPVVEVGTCEVIPDTLFGAQDRTGIRVDSFFLAPGGSAGPLRYFDLLRAAPGTLHDITLGPQATGAALGGSRFVLADVDGARIFDLAAGGGATPIELHVGAESGQALALGDRAVFVGENTSSDRVTWVEGQGVIATTLSSERNAPALLGQNGLFWLAGGGGTFDRVERAGSITLSDQIIDRERGFLFGNANQDAFLLVGGLENGLPVNDSILYTECSPQNCNIHAGPTFDVGQGATKIENMLVADIDGSAISTIELGGPDFLLVPPTRSNRGTLVHKRNRPLAARVRDLIYVFGGAEKDEEGSVEVCASSTALPLEL